MKKLALAAIVATTLAGSFTGTAVAGPPTTGPDGFLCGFTSVTNPNAEANTQTGEIDGGPLIVTDAAGNPTGGTLTCTIQVGANNLHSSPDAPGGKVSAHGDGVVVIPPSVVSYTAAPEQNVYLCTQFTYDNGRTVYWHADNDDDPTTDTGHWTEDPNKECGLAISASTPSDGPIHDLEILIDGIICPELKKLLPPDGDIANVWDCPPYGS